MGFRTWIDSTGDVQVDDDGWRVCETCRADFNEDGGTDEVRGELLCWDCIDELARQGDADAIRVAGGDAK